MIVVADRLPAPCRRATRSPSTCTWSATCGPSSRAPRSRAHLPWTEGAHVWRWRGDIPADACQRVGTMQIVVPDVAGPMSLDLSLRWADGEAQNRYETTILGA